MAIYIVNCALILLWSVLFFSIGKPTKVKKAAFLILSFTQMLLLCIFRMNIGYDFQMYVEGFYRMTMDGFSSLTYLDWEIGFVLFTKLFALLTHNHFIYLGFIALFCLLSTAIFFYRHSSMPWLSTILFVNLYFLYFNMNFLRQAIALAITLYAWDFIKKNKFWPFLAIVILASLFHTTALILIPAYLVIKIKPSAKLLMLYAYALLFFYISSDGFINLATKVFHTEYQNSILLQGLSFVYAILPIFMLAAVYLFRKQIMELSPPNRYLIGLGLLGTFFMIIMAKHAILERLSYYAFFYVTLLMPEWLQGIKTFDFTALGKRKKEKTLTAVAKPKPLQSVWLARIATVVLLAGTYAYHFYGMYAGVHGVFPYTAWLPMV